MIGYYASIHHSLLQLMWLLIAIDWTIVI